MKKKKKSTLDLMQEIRGTWSINPRTRVHDNNERKNGKKIRQKSRITVKEALKDFNRELRSKDSRPFNFYMLAFPT